VPELNVTVEATVPSTVNTTLPVGFVLPDTAATVAVNVTDVPILAGFALAFNVVVVSVAVDIVTLVMKRLDPDVLPARLFA
jgi:hypothetical protein